MRGDVALSADVVVVGSGAGGAVAALRLAEAGHQVVVLEEGGHLDETTFDDVEANMAVELYAERGMRATTDLGVAILQGRAIGGGTTTNWMIMLRPPEHVLDEWARRFGTIGMSSRELAETLARVEREVHASLVPDDAHSANNRLLLDGAAKLGWAARAGAINAEGCVRAGTCGLGCRAGAKRGTAKTYLPRALAAGARVHADTRAVRIERLERGGPFPKRRVFAEVLDRRTGAPRAHLTIDTKAVVLAGGAVGTPTLLARSGLGGGGVGKYLRLHPTTAVVGLYDRPIHAYSGIPLSAVCDEHAKRDANGYGFWIECPPWHPGIAATAEPGFGAEHAARMAEYPRTGAFIALVRDGADLDASNGDVVVARDGRSRVRYRLGKKDGVHMREAMKAAARLHLAAGAKEARTLHTRPVVVRKEADLDAIDGKPVGANHHAMFSAHVNGTCRLGTDPRISGVDPHGARWDAPGVYVMDGSLLPTGLGVNPQETILALASVLSERLATRL